MIPHMNEQVLNPRKSPKKSPWQRFQNGLAVYGQPAVLTVLVLGFAAGLPLALILSTLTFWLSEVGFSRTSIGLFALVGTPYTIKFLWAPLIDRMALPFLTRRLGRRRGWLIITQVMLMAAIIAVGLSNPEENLWWTALFAVALAFFSASQDIVVDAYRIESLTEEQQAGGAAAYVWGYRIGMLLSGGGALALAEFYSWEVAYLAMAGFMLLGMAAALLRPEPEQTESEDAREWADQTKRFLAERPNLSAPMAETFAFLSVAVIGPFVEFLRRKGWWLILLFIMFFKFGDAIAGVMTSPFLQEVGFSKLEVAGVVKSWGLVATLVGLGIGGWIMGAWGMVPALWVAGILQMVSNLLFAVQAQLGADLLFLTLTIAGENLAGGLGTAVFIAYLSSLCNISYTATQYALLSSFMALARTWMSASGGYVADELGWYSFFIVTTFAAIPGLVLLYFVTRNQVPKQKKAVVENTP